jgi:hypothetical protein
MYTSPLNDAYLVLSVLLCLAVITIASIVVAPIRVSRAKFAQMQNEVKRLADEIKALQAAEQRRFLVELKSNGESKEPLAMSATKASTVSESRPPDLQVIETRELLDLQELRRLCDFTFAGERLSTSSKLRDEGAAG